VLIKDVHHPDWSRRHSHGFPEREMKAKTPFDLTEFGVKKLSLTSIFPWGDFPRGNPPGKSGFSHHSKGGNSISIRNSN
jgi:hypothetical protein